MPTINNGLAKSLANTLFPPQTVAGIHGTFTIDAARIWTYTADIAQPADAARRQ